MPFCGLNFYRRDYHRGLLLSLDVFDMQLSDQTPSVVHLKERSQTTCPESIREGILTAEAMDKNGGWGRFFNGWESTNLLLLVVECLRIHDQPSTSMRLVHVHILPGNIDIFEGVVSGLLFSHQFFVGRSIIITIFYLASTEY